MNEKIPITIARGDGIGPEIMEATLRVLDSAGAPLAIEEIEIGEKVYGRGISTGIEPDAWESLRRTKLFLKAPITTPQGGGVKSLNVTTRKTLGLYANVRPCVSYHPFVRTKHPVMDVVIVRENEEDTYSGIEHRQNAQVVQCLKLISRPGCERIVRYAFEYARANGRRKVSCFVKDNIMKLTDGLFHTVFKEIAKEYSSIQSDSWIVDIGAARLADTPEIFDVIVMENLYGDILSDVAAQIAGSVGLAGSSNVGDHCAMFEAIHGSAPTIAGQDIANPSGIILSSVMMLTHVGQFDIAERIHNAWYCALEDGIHTADIYDPAVSKRKVGTKDFAGAVIARLGQRPQKFSPAAYSAASGPQPIRAMQSRPVEKKETVGVDVFVDWIGSNADELARKLNAASGDGLRMTAITNRGVKVWPDGFPETFCVDHWRCRFVSEPEGSPIVKSQIISLLERIDRAGLDFIKIENLCTFDGVKGYALGAGE